MFEVDIKTFEIATTNFYMRFELMLFLDQRNFHRQCYDFSSNKLTIAHTFCLICPPSD